MVGDALTGGDSRAERVAKAVVVFGLAIPVVLVVGLYAGSRAAGLVFGNVVFVLTGVTALGWLVFVAGIGGRRMDAARPTGELLRNSATRYGADGEREAGRGRLPTPARALVALTGTVVFGWASLLVTL